MSDPDSITHVSRYFSANFARIPTNVSISLRTMRKPSRIWSTEASSMISCVVAPQWMYFAISAGVPSTSCHTSGRTGYPTRSVSVDSRSKLYT